MLQDHFYTYIGEDPLYVRAEYNWKYKKDGNRLAPLRLQVPNQVGIYISIDSRNCG